MPANRILNSASGIALPLATETAVVTVTPAPGFNQVPVTPGNNVEIKADIVVTGAASATTCTLRLRRGAGTSGTDIIFGADPVLSVDAAATDRSASVTTSDTAAGFNGANGVYTLTATAAGAAQNVRIASISVHPLASGI